MGETENGTEKQKTPSPSELPGKKEKLTFKTKEKMETQAERQTRLAEKNMRRAETARQRAEQAYRASEQATAGIVPGQPILVGHHSEKQHRKALDTSWRKMGESVKESEKAEEYDRRAEASATNDAVFASDADAVELLEKKIAVLERVQDKMKKANAVIRKTRNEAERTARLTEIGFTEAQIKEMLTPDCFGGIGFQSFTLKNNNANIRRLKERLEVVRRNKGAETAEYEINGVRVEENPPENRIKLFFPGKPDEQTRQAVKRMGYRWTPSQGCWQAYYNRWNIRQTKEYLNEKYEA